MRIFLQASPVKWVVNFFDHYKFTEPLKMLLLNIADNICDRIVIFCVRKCWPLCVISSLFRDWLSVLEHWWYMWACNVVSRAEVSALSCVLYKMMLGWQTPTQPFTGWSLVELNCAALDCVDCCVVWFLHIVDALIFPYDRGTFLIWSRLVLLFCLQWHL